MAKSSDKNYTIWYEGYYELADEVESIGEQLDGLSAAISEANNFVREYHAVYHQLGKSVVKNLEEAANSCGLLNIRLGKSLPRALRVVAMVVEEHERQARNAWHMWGANGAVRSDSFDHDGMANDFYAAAAATAAQEEADRIQTEKDEQKRQEDEDKRKAEEERIQGIIAAISPTAARELSDRMTEAAFQELLEYYKDDPVMLEKIQKDYEAWKKACEERDKALAEGGEYADGVGLGGSDYASGLDGGYGGGGGGGLGEFDTAFDGGGWGSDWADDLLEDNLDTEGFWDADGAVDDIMGSSLSDPFSSGADAAGDAANLGETGVFGQYGEQLATIVQAYGLQAALAVGGGVALYATREQTIEAAAHVAEFVSTKCKPAVNDVMEQVRGMAKQTRVNLNKATSNVKAAARGEEAGDLIG